MKWISLGGLFIVLITRFTPTLPLPYGQNNEGFEIIVFAAGVIYSVDPNTSIQQQLTEGGMDSSPMLSPSGQEIAFVRQECGFPTSCKSNCSYNDSIFEIYSMGTDGSNAHALTNLDNISSELVWSPDGEHIAFINNGCNTPTQIYVMDADGQNLRQLTNEEYLYNLQPVWLPDGTGLLFLNVRNEISNIYHVDLKGGDVQKLNDVEVFWSDMGLSFAVAPNRQEIAYLDNQGGIAVMDMEGNYLRQLTRSNRFNNAPIWSPDGERLTFLSWFERMGPGTCCYPRVYVVNADGSGEREISHNENSTAWRSIWSPDSQEIAYVLDTLILAAKVNGGSTRLVAANNFSPEDLSWFDTMQ